MSSLSEKHCASCSADSLPLDNRVRDNLLTRIDGWQLSGQAIVKTYRFKDYYKTMAFANAVAWIAHNEDHHPQLVINYNTCQVEYSTHSVGGLTENDFICAAKVDSLLGKPA